MVTAESVKNKIIGLIAKANDKTGKTDPNLTTAVDSLVEGYGMGGGSDYPVYDGEPLDITETALTDNHAVFKAETEPMIVDGEVAVKMNKNNLGGIMAEQVPEGYTFTSRYGINQVGKMPVYDYTPIEGHYFREDGEGNFVFDAPVESFVVLEDEVSIKVPKEDFGNTPPHMVVDGWEFTSAGGVKQKGTMPVYDYTPIEGSFDHEDGDNLLFMAPSPQQQVVEDELWIAVPKDDFGNAQPEDVTEGVVFTSAEGYRQVGTHKCSGGGGDRTMEDGLVARTLTEYINNTVTRIGNYAFGNFASLEYVSLPNVTEMEGGNHFASCTKLKRVNIPNLKTSISSSGNNFRGCTALTELRFPLYNGILAVSGCTALKVYEVATPYNIAASSFSNLTSFDTLVMHCTKVIPLANISAFTGTPFAAGGTGGKVYVPQQYVEQYKTATNWSVLYEAGTCEFIAIEGSEYE